ncbi:MAG TPA: hypothetical protein VFE58_04015 [Tepidisphaeraceae bacterium]|jgi:hypothetical protein|nr:hypothetical protein [Tepidisphaeraceae bacterium]
MNRALKGLALVVAAWLVVGCRSYNQVAPQREAVLMVDQGKVKTLRPVEIDYSPALSSKHVKDTYLIPDEVRKFDVDTAEWAVSFSPAWLRGAAWDAGRWVSFGQPVEMARWLVSANPTVVALGAMPVGAEGGGVRPITINDLENRVSRVVVLDRWEMPPSGVISAPPAGVRTVELTGQPTLREVMEKEPWKLAAH